MFITRLPAIALASALTSLSATAQSTAGNTASDKPEGYLCCNMRSDGKWVSDINYLKGAKRTLPLGTPLKVSGYGRHRVHVRLDDGSEQTLGNDYSRELDLPAFTRRYVVADDPRKQLATIAPELRASIEAGRVMVGMTREQAIMALGYPVTSENPSLDAATWQYRISDEHKVLLRWDAAGKLQNVVALPEARRLVLTGADAVPVDAAEVSALDQETAQEEDPDLPPQTAQMRSKLTKGDLFRDSTTGCSAWSGMLRAPGFPMWRNRPGEYVRVPAAGPTRFRYMMVDARRSCSIRIEVSLTEGKKYSVQNGQFSKDGPIPFLGSTEMCYVLLVDDETGQPVPAHYPGESEQCKKEAAARPGGGSNDPFEKRMNR